MDDIYPFISQVYEPLVSNATDNSLHSKISVAFADQKVTGYVHPMPQGSGILITDDLIPYIIPTETIIERALSTGDRIDASVAYSPAYDRYIVTGIDNIHRINYDERHFTNTGSKISVDRHEANLGDTVLVHVGNSTSDIHKKIETLAFSLPADTAKIVLSFDGRPGKLPGSEVYCTQLAHTSRDKVTMCLLCFFKAKELAMQKKNVVLIIDTFDKMFHTYNSCMTTGGFINPTYISPGAVTDFESIIRSGGVVTSGGSLTIVGLLRKGTTAPQQYIADRLMQICDLVI
jgi:hypothetical protein